ncbi:tRNA (guanosine(46)-N7)-methyltransferase TrmB [Microlunatus elymi]|uniref:tRNA (guanosine(46)-N7)-methyltransferase TrmB n=1 Tax=Microlunatus elymi TaxID=2596828 RepID=UPI001D1981F0|nr:tRNA (guanosine(46)-N7)-methyltransferase TrmB [Microlunatus elymi]
MILAHDPATAADGAEPTTSQAHPDRHPTALGLVEQKNRRGVVSFVRRSPRLTPQQQRLWDRFHDQWLIEVPRHGNSTSIDPHHGIDLAAEFGRSAPLIIEIGPGMGESLVPMAAARPEANVLAFEVYRPAIARIMAKIDRQGNDNVRIIQANAVEGLRQLAPPAGVDELWMFFPDPWHKSKHRKRRLLNHDFAELVASRLRPAAVWRLATDWADYAQQMRTVLDDHEAFESLHPGGYAPRWDARPITKFEQRGIDEGREIFDLAYRRR